jgi:hypothetical protein
MNAAALLLILQLVQKTVDLAPAIVELIQKAKNGEDVTAEEIEQAEKRINDAVANWNDANPKGKGTA